MQEVFKEKIKQDTDFAEEVFNRGVAEGAKHKSPSPETIERLNKIEETLDKMISDFKDHSRKSEDRTEQMLKEFQEGMKDVKHITELLSNANFMKNFFITAGGLVVFFGSTYLLFKNIFYGQD